jgi:hypothetical protein
MSVQMRSLLLAAIVAAFGAKLAQCAEPPLTMTISLADGGVEKTNSPVVVSVTLTNHSGRTLSASQWDYDDDYTIDVRDAQGNSAPESQAVRNTRSEVEACRNSGKAVCGRKILLHGVMSRFRPGESWQETLLIAKYYDMSRPGKYTIQLERKLPEELGTYTVKLNPITVTLTGDDNRDNQAWLADVHGSPVLTGLSSRSITWWRTRRSLDVNERMKSLGSL